MDGEAVEVGSEVAVDEAQTGADAAVEQSVAVAEVEPVDAATVAEAVPEAEAEVAEAAVFVAAPLCVMQPSIDALYAWLGEHVHNSPASRDTDTYNRIYASVMDIRAALASVKE